MRKKAGFTLIEMMVVIGIIALLAGLLLGGLTAAKNKAKRTRARSDVEQIASAWRSYFADYRHFPDVGPGDSFKLTEMDNDAVRILQGNYAGANGKVPDNRWSAKNPRRTKYLDFHPRYTHQKDKNGKPVKGFVDPWGKLYQISLDVNPYDGHVKGNTGQDLSYSVAVWSMGPDGVSGSPDDAADDICSWDKR